MKCSLHSLIGLDAENFWNWLKVEDTVYEALNWEHIGYCGCCTGQNIWEQLEKFWKSSDGWYYVGIFVVY